MRPSDFQKWDKIFFSSIGFSDGGNWLVIVNARFPKKDKIRPASIGKSDEGMHNISHLSSGYLFPATISP